MYNEERKRRYIAYRESTAMLSPGALERRFSKTEPFEAKYGKDVCEWTLKEIVEFYKYLDLYSISSITVWNSDLTLYTNWCLTETLVPDAQNHFLEVRSDTMQSCVNTVYLQELTLPRDELIENIDRLPNYTDRWMFLAFFEGICGAQYIEMTSARFQDITDNNMKLCTGRTVAVTNKLREIAYMAAKEDAYQSMKSSGVLRKYDDSLPDDLLFKTRTAKDGNRGQGAVIQVVSRRYETAREYMGLPEKMTVKNLILAGKIHYIRQLMNETGLSLEETLAQKQAEINNQFTSNKIKSIGVFIDRYGHYFA